MPLTISQIILLILISFTFTRVYLRSKEGRIEPGVAIFWISLWVFAILVVVFPNVTTRIANRFGVGRGVDAVLYVSLIILFYLVFRTNVALENLKQEMTELVRKVAIENPKKPISRRRTKKK